MRVLIIALFTLIFAVAMYGYDEIFTSKRRFTTAGAVALIVVLIVGLILALRMADQ